MLRLEKGTRVGIVCCSNGRPMEAKEETAKLAVTLREVGLIPVFSKFLYAKGGVFSGSGRERAQALMDFYVDETIGAVFDISGGDMANEILPFLDFEIIAKSGKMFWGYSDLTTVINAIYARSGICSVLYQVRNLIYDQKKEQRENFINTVIGEGSELYTFDYQFLQGRTLQGKVVGGNIRCFLKLAGTKFWPELRDKILLLEAFGGKTAQMVTYLSQLKQIGVFEQINGILLGTFTAMEEQRCVPAMSELVRQFVPKALPIVQTGQIGHGTDAKAIVIGKEIRLIR